MTLENNERTRTGADRQISRLHAHGLRSVLSQIKSPIIPRSADPARSHRNVDLKALVEWEQPASSYDSTPMCVAFDGVEPGQFLLQPH